LEFSRTKEIDFSISTGLFYKHISNVILYEHSLPLIFQLSLEIPQNIPSASAFKNLHCPNETIYPKEVCDAANHLKSLHSHISSHFLSIPHPNKFHSRDKRAIFGFVGDLLNYCCNVAESNDINNLHQKQDHIEETMILVQKQLLKNNIYITNTTNELLKFQEQIKSNFDKMEHFSKKFVQQQVSLAESLNSLSNKVEIEAMAFLSEFQETLLQLVKFFQIHRYEQTLDSCRNNKLHPNVLPYNVLLSHLSKFRSNLAEHNFQLAIDTDLLEMYYSLPIVSCSIYDSSIFVKLKIPIISSKQKFSLFSVNPIPFGFRNQTCTIDIIPSLVAISDKKQIVPILGSDILNCQYSRSKLCKIPIHVSTSSRVAECLNQGYFAKTIKEIIPSCDYKCLDSVMTQAFETDSHQYVITHPPSNITISIKGNISIISISNEAKTGAIRIKLPCHSELIITKHLFIRSEFPCFDNELVEPEIFSIFFQLYFLKTILFYSINLFPQILYLILLLY
jgi:hypothetical protein